MKKKKPKIYYDAYSVKFNYQKIDGYWTQLTKTVLVPILDWKKEKGYHLEAEKMILKEYPNAQIVTVTYQ